LMNCNHFQLMILAYNLNCWLMRFQPRGTGPISHVETYYVSDRPSALSLSRGQDLASRQQGWCQPTVIIMRSRASSPSKETSLASQGLWFVSECVAHLARHRNSPYDSERKSEMAGQRRCAWSSTFYLSLSEWEYRQA